MRIATLLMSIGLPLAAQSVTTGFAGAGYRNPPNAVEAAPGQVLIVSVHGAQTRVADPVYGKGEPGTGMPTTVAGFSVDLVQSTGRTPAILYGVSQTACAP